MVLLVPLTASGSVKVHVHTCTCKCTVVVASYPDLPAHMQTFTRNYFLSHRKAGRSGRFGDVVMMSPGRGLEESLECERVQALPTFLGSRRCQMTLKTLKGKRSVLCKFQKLTYLPFFVWTAFRRRQAFWDPLRRLRQS